VTIDYVTLFDSSYLAQGMTMVMSLLKESSEPRIWVVAADSGVAKAVASLGDDRVISVDLHDVENEDLLQVKGSRSKVEYFWTLTPYLPTWVFEHQPDAEVVVYVDADMYFLGPPEVLLQEFLDDSDASVMITPHDYAPEYDQTRTSGTYCVQFLPFRRVGSVDILSTWQAQCLEWCYQRLEPGRFGDQKYLDDWPSKYGTRVLVQVNTHLLAAPWNLRFRHPKAYVAFHFHALRRVVGRLVALHPGYVIPHEDTRHLYDTYLDAMTETSAGVGADLTVQVATVVPRRRLLRRILVDTLRGQNPCAAIRLLPRPIPVSSTALTS
jgi:hypothetical protein